jgi:hypothetical protein
MLVFGIGLNKTGTTSLHAALELLGLRAIHHAGRVKRAIAADRAHGRPPLSGMIARGYQGFVDSPVWMYVRELDESYPGARFIYTTRPVEDWIASRRRHIEQRVFGRFRYRHWNMDPEHLRRVWREHDALVRARFADRSDLLVLDVCGGEGWERLCPFLGVAVPDAPFPWHKKASR